MFNKNILTATDIVLNDKNLEEIIDGKVIAFNKKRLRKVVKEYKDKKQTETNSENVLVTKQELNELSLSLLNDQETKDFRETQIKLLKSEKENFNDFRVTLNDLNCMVDYAYQIEKAGLQTIDKFLNFDEFVLLSADNNNLLIQTKINENNKLDNHITELITKHITKDNFDELKTIEELNEYSLDILLKIREMYKINIYVDDIELFEKYDLMNNIDFADLLSEIILKKYSLGYKTKNVINQFAKSNNLINNLVYQQIITNKQLGVLLSKKFINNNQVTCLETTLTNDVNRDKVFRTRTLGELFIAISNPDAEHLSKEDREQIYMSYDGLRPSKNDYYKWNGLQVFDIDLKEWIKNDGGNIKQLKKELHNMLSDFHWYLWICTSASGKGLHIYTKVTPPHHVYLNAPENNYISQYAHLVNYNAKVSIIYDILFRLHNLNNNGILFPYKYEKNKLSGKIDRVGKMYDGTSIENSFVDNIVSRITAGIRLAFDLEPLINHNFIDLHYSLGLAQTTDGLKEMETINKVLLRNSKIKTRINETLIVTNAEDKQPKRPDQVDLSKFVSLGNDVSDVIILPKHKINYNVRYNICNTLASLFGKDGLPIAHKVLDSVSCGNVGEINSFYSCALSNRKEPSKYGLELLKQAGVIKAVEEEIVEIVETTFKHEIKNQIEKTLINAIDLIDYKLTSNQYLGNKYDEIFSDFSGENVNILFAPPGTGKCFGKDTKILMYDCSIKFVQDIVFGDVVMGWDSKPRTVISTCVDEEEMFRIIPEKGDSWTCNKSHILSLHIGPSRFKPVIWNIELSKYMKLSKTEKNNWRLFRVGVEFEKIEFDIDPYFLGYWLGDGSSNDVEFTISYKDSPKILPVLEAYLDEFDCEFSYYEYEYMTCPRYRAKSKTFDRQYNNRIENKNQVFLKFEKYDLINNKHIPKDILYSSREERLKLFAGIIDSDGTVCSKSYCISIAIKYEKFKNDLIFLSRSLGYYVNCSNKITTTKGKEYKSWFLTITGNFSDVPVLYERKIIIPSKKKSQTKYTNFSVESIGIDKYYGFQLSGGKDKMFLLDDFTVVHNTELIKQAATKGKRIMLVLPYISVIKNKIVGDPEVTQLFDTFYGGQDIKAIEYGRNIVTTFDKFSRSNFEKISKMFDYIFIDESHLLFTSSYRIEATATAIKKIKELYFISQNDPFAAQIVLTTGTETGESHFFNRVAKIIRVTKPQMKKTMEFLICGDTLDAITRMANKASQLIKDGYKILIPTNKGEIYSEKVIGMIEFLLGKAVKYGYYKRSNTEQEICRLINNENSVGDYDIVFCSNYLSVGVDINDKTIDGKEVKFASIYLGAFSGYEIEQFNARIRKTGIKSIFCIVTNNLDGQTKDDLLNEPDLLLRLTDEDQLFFIDDKSIAGAKTEFIAQYDPILHKIVTPGFSLLNGKIQFNLEEYELVTFESKYNICMQHPIKVSRELSKYGYQITVSTEFEGLSHAEQEILKSMGIEAAKQEKLRKHNLMVGTYVDLINCNIYKNEHGLEFHNTIDWINKNQDKIIEDRELSDSVGNPIFVFVEFDIFASPQKVVVRSKEALDKMIRPAKYLIKRYSSQKALEIIYQYVDSGGILKQKQFQRTINLMKLLESSEANELTEPITKTITKIYQYVDNFELNKSYRIGYDTHKAIVDSWVNSYIDELGIKINTKYGWDKLYDGINEMLNDIATRNSSSGGLRYTYNKLPDANSTTVLNRRSIDTLVVNMFNINEGITKNKRDIKEKHIILKQQEF